MYANVRRKSRGAASAAAGGTVPHTEVALSEETWSEADGPKTRLIARAPIAVVVKVGETLRKSFSVTGRRINMSGAGTLVSSMVGALTLRACKLFIQNLTCQLSSANLEACDIVLENASLIVDNNVMTCTAGTLTCRNASISCANTILSRGVQCDFKYVEWSGVVHVHDASSLCAYFSSFTVANREAFKVWYGSRDATRAHLKLMHCTIDCGGQALVDVMSDALVSIVFGALVAVHDLPFVTQIAASCLHGLVQHSGNIVLDSGACISVENDTFSVCKSYAVDGSRTALLSCQFA